MAGFFHEERRGCMKIAVIGGGAVGLLFASFLAEQGNTITIVTRRREQAEALRQNGLMRMNIDGSETIVQVAATTDYSCLNEHSLAIISVKYTQLNDVFKELNLLSTVPSLLFVQNGLAHYHEALAQSYATIGFGAVAFGAQKKDDRIVIHRGVGAVSIAVVRGNHQNIWALLSYQNELFPLRLVEDAEGMLFQKAFFNCLINPLTYLLQVKNGELLTKPHAYTILQNLYKEMVLVFPEASSIPFEQVQELCKKTALNTSSMLSDRLAGRPTEIETIAGAMLKRAETQKKDLPILRALYHLVLHYEGGDK